MCCTKCGSQNVIKSGFIKGQQRYRCKNCCYQFVPTRHHGKSDKFTLLRLIERIYIFKINGRHTERLYQMTN